VFWTLQIELVIYAACSVLYSTGLLKRAAWIATLAYSSYLVMGLGRLLLEHQAIVPGNRCLYFFPLLGFITQRYTAGLLSGRQLCSLIAGQFGSLATVLIANFLWFPQEAHFITLCDL